MITGAAFRACATLLPLPAEAGIVDPSHAFCLSNGGCLKPCSKTCAIAAFIFSGHVVAQAQRFVHVQRCFRFVQRLESSTPLTLCASVMGGV